jgi:uncharacterized protein DUF2726
MSPGTSVVVAIAAMAIVVVLAAIVASKRRPVAGKVRGRALLTSNELEFLGRLEAAVPEFRFHSQVAMGALLEPAFPKKIDPRAYMSIRGTFSQKIVDFVVQDRTTGAVLAVVELDDRTHDAAKDNKRDAMLQEGGYRIVRWQSTDKPHSAAIRHALVSTQPLGSRPLRVEKSQAVR